MIDFVEIGAVFTRQTEPMESISSGFLVAVVAVLAIGLGIAVDRFLLKRVGLNKLADARLEAKRLISEHEQRIAQADEDLNERDESFEREATETRKSQKRTRRKLEQRQDKLNRRIQRVNERENLLHKATDAVELLTSEANHNKEQSNTLKSQATSLLEYARKQRQTVDDREARLEKTREQLEGDQNRLHGLIDEHVRKLEQVSGLTREEARQILLKRIIEEVKLESAAQVKEIRDQARLTAARESRKIILTAIQRTASSHAIENTVSVVNISSDEMKGRIIGREGRNIRSFESATGIEVIVDDTPEAVILSGFDPVRREIARIALNRLIQDGRIHPARIEEVVEKSRAEIEEEIIELGERAVIDLSLHGMHPELIRLIGRMRYRTSYGQNLLAHSIETARIAALMASELGLDPVKSKRAGLLHDIGKVTEDEIESPHAIVGMGLCRKYKEDEEICNAVGAHHDEIEMTSLISPLVQSADAISGARPGARREALEAYITRLENLENLAGAFNGVERVYAIQAGREIRVIVNHDLVSDALAELLAVDISKKIKAEMQYPGQIKVTVIREVRSVSYAT